MFLLFILRSTRKAFYSLRGYGLTGSLRNIYIALRLFFYSLFLRAPGVRGQVDKQVTTAIGKLEAKLVPTGPGVSRYITLPKEGWSPEQVRAELDKLAGLDHTRWEDGRVSGAVYHGGQELLKLQAEAFGQFGVANPIHPDVFPGIRKMEAEVVAMVRYPFQTTNKHEIDLPLGFVYVQCPPGWRRCDHQRRHGVYPHGLLSGPAKSILGAGNNGARDVGCVLFDVEIKVTDYSEGSFLIRHTRRSSRPATTSRSSCTVFPAPSLISWSTFLRYAA